MSEKLENELTIVKAAQKEYKAGMRNAIICLGGSIACGIIGALLDDYYTASNVKAQYYMYSDSVPVLLIAIGIAGFFLSIGFGWAWYYKYNTHDTYVRNGNYRGMSLSTIVHSLEDKLKDDK